MVEYVKMGKEDFEIVDWVTLKEHQNKFVMEFRVKGNVKKARAMVNAKLVGLNGKYCTRQQDGTDNEIVEEVGVATAKNMKNKDEPEPHTGLRAEMEQRSQPTQAMPDNTRNL